MQILSGTNLRSLISYRDLIEALRRAFAAGDIAVPERHHHSMTRSNEEAMLLLMPAWDQEYVGVKQVTVFPGNAEKGLATIQGLYVLLDGGTGRPLIMMDAKALTNLRTAATSALAADLIHHQSLRSMLMVGTGSLAPDLVAAHASIQPLERVAIWGRNEAKAQGVVDLLQERCPQLHVDVCTDLKRGVDSADLISVATLASDPVILGEWLRVGQHLDLVGAYTPQMRETDDDAIRRSDVFIDTWTACKETGDLAIPLATGVLSRTEIKGTLQDLCNDPTGPEQVSPTVFKSVGHASEDLVCAIMAYKNYKASENSESTGTM